MLLPTFGIHCHFFRQNLYDRLPARRVTICFTLCLTQTWPCHIMSHTSLGVLPFRTAFSPLPQISVGLLLLLLLSLVEHPVTTVYIMASQDMISQFSPDSNAIPATQPDRSRTPRRPHHTWHQTVPTFRGPMHYAMTTPRPFWHPAGVPPPPPMTSSFSTRPSWTQTTQPFPPTPPTFSQQPPDHANLTPQRHTLTPRSPRPMSSPGGSPPIHEGYTCRPIEIPPVEQWKPDVDFHDSNKVNGLDNSLPKFAKADSPATKTLKVWILCKSHFGSSCTKDYTIHGSVVLPTAEKPSSFLSTT